MTEVMDIVREDAQVGDVVLGFYSSHKGLEDSAFYSVSHWDHADCVVVGKARDGGILFRHARVERAAGWPFGLRWVRVERTVQRQYANPESAERLRALLMSLAESSET